MPEPDTLLSALERRGLAVDGRVVYPRVAAAATWLIGDVIGVGARSRLEPPGQLRQGSSAGPA